MTKLNVGINGGFSWELSKIWKGEGCQKGRDQVSWGMRPLSLLSVNHCKIYCYCKTCLELPKGKPSNECTILNKLD